MLINFDRNYERSDRFETNYMRILYYDFVKNYSDTYQSYEYTRLCTILNGEKHVTIEQDHFTYDSHDFLLMPSHSKVQMTIEQPTKALVFELNDNLIKKVSENISLEYDMDYQSLIQDQLLCTEENEAFQEVYQRILRTLSSHSKQKEYLIDLYAQELIYHLLQVKGVTQLLRGVQNNPLSTSLSLMHSDYMRSLTIQEVAAALNMSEANFCQYFKKMMGITPKKYLTDLRMGKAKELIAHASVTDTAYDLGYNNISLFIAHFKETYGITPKQYQKNFSQGPNLG